MTAYESLNRVRNGKMEYERLLDKIAYLEALSQRVTPILSGAPIGSVRHGQTDEPWAALADYRTKCKEQIQQYVSACESLEKDLRCIKSERIRTVMACRYVDLMTVESIANLTKMNTRNVYRLLKKGKQIYEYHYEKGDIG